MKSARSVSNGWYNTNVALQLSASDAGSNANRIEYKEQGKNWTTYTGDIILSAEGENKVEYWSIDNAGNREEKKSIIIKIDKTKPKPAFIDSFSDADDYISGKAEKDTTAIIYSSRRIIAKGKVDKNGNFKMKIPKQQAGKVVSVSIKDAANNTSFLKSKKVKDKTAPIVTKVNKLYSSNTSVTGKAEISAEIEVKANDKIIGTSKVDKKGNFKVKIPKQKRKKQVVVTASDKGGNVSEGYVLKVK
ncbi:Ig-like domain-containing protein [Niallia sp. 03133]|uniref:Ig-like domain-containing protein n=1 Tax=Niallia sp. 03133 TaxID=3458060 RepID=UPI004043B995